MVGSKLLRDRWCKMYFKVKNCELTLFGCIHFEPSSLPSIRSGKKNSFNSAPDLLLLILMLFIIFWEALTISSYVYCRYSAGKWWNMKQKTFESGKFIIDGKPWNFLELIGKIRLNLKNIIFFINLFIIF